LPSVTPMVCQELVEVVTAYLDGSLSAADRERLDAHLRHCEPCLVYIEQLRQTIEHSGAIEASDLPPEARSELLTLFRDWREPQKTGAS
jgi:anti-sigma factor RsiW